jgi:hypothetical protein
MNSFSEILRQPDAGSINYARFNVEKLANTRTHREECRAIAGSGENDGEYR